MTDTLTTGDRHATASASHRTKLIEVALPLEAINTASAHEKSVKVGKPTSVHLWWARRPLATCRAVLFAQLVDDPSAWPNLFPTEEAQEAERQRLFRIIEQLVQWENSTSERVLFLARREIARSLAREAGIPEPEVAEDVWTVLREHAPPVLDPFCGGGSIPLEAQRLGLEVHACDLNPVAVLITRALVEIPNKFRGRPPVNADDSQRIGATAGWEGMAGLAADIGYYGKWLWEEASRRIGHLYPRVRLPREDGGGEATVIAWLWARTVMCPNPACRACLPLVRSFLVSSKHGKESWIDPKIDRERKTVTFDVRRGGRPAIEGTVNRLGAECLVCGASVTLDYLRAEGRAGRMGQRLIGIVAEGPRGRIYLPPTDEQAKIAEQSVPAWVPDTSLPEQALGFRVQLYGMTTHDRLFTVRQLAALSTLGELVRLLPERIREDAFSDNPSRPRLSPELAHEYANAVTTYLAFAVSRCVDWNSSLCRWESKAQVPQQVMGRQTISMVWDFAESNILSQSTGSLLASVSNVQRSVAALIPSGRQPAVAAQRDATSLVTGKSFLVCTDPPYYDNIGYADLSDFFYVWLRVMLRPLWPDLFRTVLTPKTQELIANPFMFGGDTREAAQFFESTLEKVFRNLRGSHNRNYPTAVFYAFKQAESDPDRLTDKQVASTGWESMLRGLLDAGFSITGTWPMRTEGASRMRAIAGGGSNALASSIVLVCRARPAGAALATRREFITALRAELPPALVALQHGNIAPVDLAQASIGPGMAVFSRYSKVLEADGSPMSVRTALQIINQELDRYLAEQEGEMDSDTRFCIAWYEQYGLRNAKYGEAEVLAKAKNTSVEGLVRAGVLRARGGEVRLLGREELDPNWNPQTDQRLTDWECTQYLIRALQTEGETEAARLAGMLGGDRAQRARDLAYRLYAICDRKNRAEEAGPYNELVISWPAILELAARQMPTQQSFI